MGAGLFRGSLDSASRSEGRGISAGSLLSAMDEP
jgi:hypothetical protein